MPRILPWHTLCLFKGPSEAALEVAGLLGVEIEQGTVSLGTFKYAKSFKSYTNLALLCLP